jgi:CRP/FNR family transcriptional regulator, cyclic AMP receptor protein
MNEHEISLALVKIPLLRNLTAPQLQNLAQVVVEREFTAGAKIVEQGANGVGLFVLVSGKANVVFQHLDGHQSILNTFGPSDFFGELALLDEGPRTASVIAVEPTRCLVIASWDFLQLLKVDNEMAIIILKEISHRMRMSLESQ